MRIAIENKNKILSLDEEQYEFVNINMHKKKPIWIVELVDGNFLHIDFGEPGGIQ